MVLECMFLVQPLGVIIEQSMLCQSHVYHMSKQQHIFEATSQNSGQTILANWWRWYMVVRHAHWVSWVLQTYAGWLVGWLVFNSTFSTNRLYRATGVWNIFCKARGQDKYKIKQ